MDLEAILLVVVLIAVVAYVFGKRERRPSLDFTAICKKADNPQDSSNTRVYSSLTAPPRRSTQLLFPLVLSLSFFDTCA